MLDGNADEKEELQRSRSAVLFDAEGGCMSGGSGRLPLVAIVGPTAAGKSALALELALTGQAEVVSVDSRQIFRHLDIGTAKPTAEMCAQVPHHLIDVAEPDESYDAGRFGRERRGARDSGGHFNDHQPTGLGALAKLHVRTAGLDTDLTQHRQ